MVGHELVFVMYDFLGIELFTVPLTVSCAGQPRGTRWILWPVIYAASCTADLLADI